MKRHIFLYSVVIAVAASAVAPISLAHDYWLQPEAFILPSVKLGNAPVRVHMHVGSGFESELERPMQKERTVRFELFTKTAQLDLLRDARDGQTPLVEFTPLRDGTHLLALERTPQQIELPASEFNEYLREEGLEVVLRLRQSTGADKRSGRERYRRYIKSLVQVGDSYDESYKQKVGQQLEITPLDHPYRIKRGDTLRVQVWFEGKPLRSVKLFAFNLEHTTRLAQTTNEEGIAKFKLDAQGIWMLRLVQMRRCENCTDADWESFWSSYTFAMR